MSCFSNPAFLDPHGEYIVIPSEGDTSLEHTLSSHSKGKDAADTISSPSQFIDPVSSPTKKDLDHTNKPKRPEKLPISAKQAVSSLKRSTPVTPTEKPKIPPPRPPAITPDKKQPPLRPPLPNNIKLIDLSSPVTDSRVSLDTSEDLEFTDDFINIPHCRTVVETQNEGHAVILPNSPFFSPTEMFSSGLFADTMGSLSEESRSLITDRPNSIVEEGASMNPFTQDKIQDLSSTDNTNLDIFDQSDDSICAENNTDLKLNTAFNETTSSTDYLPRSTSLRDKAPVTSKGEPVKNDPFAGFYEIAKKDFQLDRKR